MLHLKPIPESEASEPIRLLYQDIKSVLHVPTIPLIFQYISNYPHYFHYVWGRIKANITATDFLHMQKEVIGFADMTTNIIYTPSPDVVTFVSLLASPEKHNISDTVNMLSQLNATLLIISVAIRESIKGIVVPQQFLPQGPSSVNSNDELFMQMVNEQTYAEIHKEENGTNFLVPLFGKGDISIARYPDYFNRIAQEMEMLIATEAYLKTRVELEHITLLYTKALPVPLATSYREIQQYIKDQPHFYDLLHLLKNIFPSIFPRLLLTSSVMQKTLKLQ